MHYSWLYGIILTRDILFCPITGLSLLLGRNRGQKTRRRCTLHEKYELTVVVNAKIEDDERAQVIEKVKDLVTRFGGNVTDVDEWGKRRLAYEIQKMKEAYYYFIHFESDATVPGEVEERIRIMDNVLRYLCVKDEA